MVGWLVSYMCLAFNTVFGAWLDGIGLLARRYFTGLV